MAFDFAAMLCAQVQKQFDESGYPQLCEAGEPETVMVPMGDGVRLKTFVFRPAEVQGKLPVIFQRTCYPNQEKVYRIYGENFAKRGYAFVLQYSRGRGGSEGVWEPNVNERRDGIDAVDWLCAQPWCGVIGCWGHSYSAMTGWAVADAVEGKVASMLLQDYGTDRFVSAYEKGAFRHDVLTSWSMENAAEPVHADYLESCRYMPQSEVDEKLWGQRVPSYRQYIASPKLSDPLWQSGWWKQLREIPEKTAIPILVLSGWYDHHHGSSMKTWERLGAAAKEHSRLVIGGWNHFFSPCLPDKQTEQNQGEEILRALEWFELTLKERKLPEQEVRYYEIGKDSWSVCRDWKPQENRKKCLYFGVLPGSIANEAEQPGSIGNEVGQPEGSGNGTCQPESIGNEAGQPGSIGNEACQQGSAARTAAGAGTGKLSGVLSAALPEEAAQLSYIYDPENPVETTGGEGLLKNMDKVGSLPQPPCGYRDDVLSFVSEPLDEPLSICGRPSVKLYVGTDGEDTAFTAKLMEVTPEGKAYHIRSSITSIGAELAEGERYEPGSTVEVTVDMWDIAYTVGKGSRIRVDISSSDFPLYSIHSNYAGLWSEQTKVRAAKQTVRMGGACPSCIVLPYIETVNK